MPADKTSAVFHVTAAAGGGADRYIRDLAATTSRRHFALHVGSTVDVLEDLGNRRFFPVSPVALAARADALSAWFRDAGIGLVHLHSVDEFCRARLAALLRAASLPYVATLHDLLFLNPKAFEFSGMPAPDREWVGEVSHALKGASMVIAPSAFIRSVALDASLAHPISVIAPGIRPQPLKVLPPAPADFAADAPLHVIAVVGAVGPHKGSRVLEELARKLEGSRLCIVVIGYTDTALARGWLVPGRLYVHGPYIDDSLAGWLHAYRTEVVLFPNRLPESFSYTLSEIWGAGLPVIVPAQGALGERVANLGGGWCLPAEFNVAEALAFLEQLFSPVGATERSRVESMISPLDPARIPTLEAMSRDVDALYARYALPPASTADADAARDALAPLLAANLDGFVFRKELLSLAGQLEQAKVDVAEATRWSAQLERDSAAWAAKLEADIATLRRDHASEAQRFNAESERLAEQNARTVDENRRLVKQNARLDAENRRLAEQNGRVQDDNRRLTRQNAKLTEDNHRIDQLTGDLDRVNADLDALRQQAARQASAAADRVARYEAQLATLRDDHGREIDRLAAEIRRLLGDEIRPLTDENRRLGNELGGLAAENRRLGDEVARLTPYQAALELGPQIVQKYLFRKLARARR